MTVFYTERNAHIRFWMLDSVHSSHMLWPDVLSVHIRHNIQIHTYTGNMLQYITLRIPYQKGQFINNECEMVQTSVHIVLVSVF